MALYEEWEERDSESDGDASDGEGDGAVSDGKSNSDARPRLWLHKRVAESDLKSWHDYAPWLVSNDIAAADAGFRHVHI